PSPAVPDIVSAIFLSGNLCTARPGATRAPARKWKGCRERSNTVLAWGANFLFRSGAVPGLVVLFIPFLRRLFLGREESLWPGRKVRKFQFILKYIYIYIYFLLQIYAG